MAGNGRRQFIKIAAVGAVGAALGIPTHSAADPVLGMIFPPANTPVPPEARLMYPSGVRFLAEPYSPPWGGHRCFAVDPDGNLIELEEPA